jgi:hypothetical protein
MNFVELAMFYETKQKGPHSGGPYETWYWLQDLNLLLPDCKSAPRLKQACILPYMAAPNQ